MHTIIIKVIISIQLVLTGALRTKRLQATRYRYPLCQIIPVFVGKKNEAPSNREIRF